MSLLQAWCVTLGAQRRRTDGSEKSERAKKHFPDVAFSKGQSSHMAHDRNKNPSKWTESREEDTDGGRGKEIPERTMDNDMIRAIRWVALVQGRLPHLLCSSGISI
jgi:hypothetical protein